jgi:hypothetical protein
MRMHMHTQTVSTCWAQAKQKREQEERSNEELWKIGLTAAARKGQGGMKGVAITKRPTLLDVSRIIHGRGHRERVDDD